MDSRVRGALLALVCLVTPALLHAQAVAVGISRDTIRVGDPFRAVLRIDLPAGVDVALPDSLPATEDIENAGRMRMRRDSANGTSSIIAAYPLTAWRPGELALPDLNVEVKSATGVRSMAIAMPKVRVISVLPADTTNIQAKPPKDVLGPNRLWWLWLLLALAIALALGLAYWWWRRRQRLMPEAEVIPIIPPRQRALEELERIKQLGLVEERAYKRFYTLLSEVLRQYMSTLDRTWSTDLTTYELSRKLRGSEELQRAMAVLRNADMVKFARNTPMPDEAVRDLDRARAFVTDYPAPATTPAPAEGFAA